MVSAEFTITFTVISLLTIYLLFIYYAYETRIFIFSDYVPREMENFCHPLIKATSTRI